MSDYERFKGEIQLIPRNENESDKDYFERATNKPYSYDFNGIQDYDCIYEAIYENSIYKDFICIGNNIYKFNELKSLDPYGSYCNIQKIEEGKCLKLCSIMVEHAYQKCCQANLKNYK